MLAAITASSEILEQKIEKLVIDVNLLRVDQSKLEDKVKENAASLRELKHMVKNSDSLTKAMANQVDQPVRRMEDLEGRSHRNNIRVVGLPEGVEGMDMLTYLETWLREEVAAEGLMQFFFPGKSTLGAIEEAAN